MFPVPGNVRIRFNPTSISAALWTDPFGRSDDVEFLTTILREGDVYVDCGANIGHLALVASRLVGTGGRVTAIEASPRTFSFLLDNLAINGVPDARVLQCALGERDGGIVQISERRDDDQNRVTDSGVPVPVRSLDSVLGPARVTLLKIDVEGYELFVLRGARGVLQRTDVVYCELSASNCGRYGYGPAEVERLLVDHGFCLLMPRVGRFERRASVYDALGPEEIPTTGYNLIAVHERFLDELARRAAQAGIGIS